MKFPSRITRVLPALALSVAFAPSGFAAPAKFHIGICTETVTQAEDDLRGAEQLIKEYGSVSDGGMVRHITYPEVDRCAWFSPEEARRRMNAAQAAFVDRLLEHLD